ncbi:MAG: hypothetical protein NTX22_10225 [Ignavibacteriales bacterium]|nr:hypothetical protein [Ignavibacteriales bacterium]
MDIRRQYKHLNYGINLLQISIDKYANSLKEFLIEQLKKNDLPIIQGTVKELKLLNDFKSKLQHHLEIINKFYCERLLLKEKDNATGNNSTKKIQSNFVNEILSNLEEFDNVTTVELKDLVLNESRERLSIEDLQPNSKLTNYLNWEIHFYKCLSKLADLKYVDYNAQGFCWNITDTGIKYVGNGYNNLSNEENNVITEEEILRFKPITYSDSLMFDFLSSYRDYIVEFIESSDENFCEEINHFNVYLANKIFSISDEREIEDFDEIKLFHYYKIQSVARIEESIVIVNKKFDVYRFIETVNQENEYEYYIIV